MTTIVVPTRPWIVDAACRNANPADFFVGGKGGGKGRTRGRVEAAKQCCESCVVQVPCREYALIYEPYGIWGGMTEEERRDERRRRGIELVLISSGLR